MDGAKRGAKEKEWKSPGMARMEIFDIWEKSETRVEQKNEGRGAMAMADFVCRVRRKVCRLKGGLTVHRRRMHKVLAKRKERQCEQCEEAFRKEANLLNH